MFCLKKMFTVVTSYLCAFSNSPTADKTTLSALFSALRINVANFCCTSETLNKSTVSFGAIWRALKKTKKKNSVMKHKI